MSVWRAVLEDDLPLSAAPHTDCCASMVILEGITCEFTLRLRTKDKGGAVVSDRFDDHLSACAAVSR